MSPEPGPSLSGQTGCSACAKGTQIDWAQLKKPANAVASAALTHAGFSGLRASDAKRQAWNWLHPRARAIAHRQRLRPGWAVTFTPMGRVELLASDVAGPGPDEVLVRTTISALSPGTERARYLGLPNAKVAPGYVPGFSSAGVVDAVGTHVTTVAPGDRVAVLNGTHRSITRTRPEDLVRIPDDVDDSEAAFTHLGVIALQGVVLGDASKANAVAVIGLGVIGALAQRLCVMEGAACSVVVARSTAKLRPGRPAPDRILTTSENPRDIEQLRAPVVLDVTGDPRAIDLAVDIADIGGRVVLLGSSRGNPVPFPVEALRQRELEVVGAHVETTAMEHRSTGVDIRRKHAERFLGYLASGELSVSDLVDVVADPREPELLYRRLVRDRDLVGAVFDWRSMTGSSGNPWARLPAVHAPGVDYGHHPVPAPRVRMRPPPRAGTPVLGLGLAGCGDIALLNAAAIRASSNTTLHACFDPVHELAVDLAAQHDARVTRSYEELLAAPEVQAVFLCVPHDLHWPLAEQAFSAGKHVIVEKPPAHRLEDTAAMVAAAASAGVKLTFCLPSRYEPASRAAAWLLRRGAVGELRGGSITFLADRPPGYFAGGLSGRTSSTWRTMPDRAGGGIVIMNLTHHLDLLLHLAGDEVMQVSATTTGFDSPTGIEDAASMTLAFANGAIVTVQGATHVRGTAHEEFRLWGSQGHLELRPNAQLYTMRTLPGYRTGRWQRLALPEAIDPRQAVVSSFAAAVASDTTPDIPPTAGLRLQAVLDAAYRSSRSGRAEPLATSPVMAAR